MNEGNVLFNDSLNTYVHVCVGVFVFVLCVCVYGWVVVVK